MRALERRLLQLEQAISLAKCLCSQRIVVFAGDPEPKQAQCSQHRRLRVIRWPLPRSPLDGTELVEASEARTPPKRGP